MSFWIQTWLLMFLHFIHFIERKNKVNGLLLTGQLLLWLKRSGNDNVSSNKTAGDDIGVQTSKKGKKKDKKSSPTPKKSSNKLYVVPREKKAVAKPERVCLLP